MQNNHARQARGNPQNHFDARGFRCAARVRIGYHHAPFLIRTHEVNIMRRLAALLILTPALLTLATAALAADIAWPDLPKTCYVKGRAGNVSDVRNHCGAFVATSKDGKMIGKALKVVVPQYAYHIDPKTKKKTPVILLQAEDAMGIPIAGFQVVGGGGMMVDTLGSLELLGTKKPK
jgi:hypothetical protein